MTLTKCKAIATHPERNRYLTDRVIAIQAELAQQQAEAIANQQSLIANQQSLIANQQSLIADQERQEKLQERQEKEKLAAYLKSLGINPDDIPWRRVRILQAIARQIKTNAIAKVIKKAITIQLKIQGDRKSTKFDRLSRTPGKRKTCSLLKIAGD